MRALAYSFLVVGCGVWGNAALYPVPARARAQSICTVDLLHEFADPAVAANYVAVSDGSRFQLQRVGPTPAPLLDVAPMPCAEWRQLVLSLVALDHEAQPHDAQNVEARIDAAVANATPDTTMHANIAGQSASRTAAQDIVALTHQPNDIQQEQALRWGAALYGELVRTGDIGFGVSFDLLAPLLAVNNSWSLALYTQIGGIPYPTNMQLADVRASLWNVFARAGLCAEAQASTITWDVCATVATQIIFLHISNSQHQAVNPTVDAGGVLRAQLALNSTLSLFAATSLEGRAIYPEFILVDASGATVRANLTPISLQIALGVAGRI